MVAPITPREARRPGVLSDVMVQEINRKLDGKWLVSEFKRGRQVLLPLSVSEDDRLAIVTTYEAAGWAVTIGQTEDDGPGRPGLVRLTFDIKRE